MLSYRHLFHAGAFSDVFKHALLSRLLIALGEKDKPYFYLDTHAGTGRYDLNHSWAQKAREYENGIARLWTMRDVPPALQPYMDAVRTENPAGTLRWYPGSPRIAQCFLRNQDRLALTELNRDDCESLGTLFAGAPRTSVQHMDGYQALKAYLPPQERRGMVLLDSSFDQAREYARIARAINEAHQRWATGTYAIWYPLMEPYAVRAFEQRFVDSGMRKVLKLEFSVEPEGWMATLRGCGMLVVNPPWKFDREAAPLLDWLWHALSRNGEGSSRVQWLVKE